MNKVLFFLSIIVIPILFFIILEKGRTANQFTAGEFRQLHTQIPGTVIDVRTQDEFDAGHLAITEFHYDFLNGHFEANLESLDKNETYYLYCRSGNRSGKALKIMKNKGFEKIYNIGGYDSLKTAGFATEK